MSPNIALTHQQNAQMNPSNFPQPMKDKSKGAIFIIFVYLWIFLGSIGYNIAVGFPIDDGELSLSQMITVGAVDSFFVLFIIAFTKAACTDPGRVPPHYGFYLGDETKRRRYCKVCHVWKPERSHHCSTCNRCVLQMDHHCVWINNCVGFYNRKFFVQLIGYGLIWLTLLTADGLYMLFVLCSELWPKLYYGTENVLMNNYMEVGRIVLLICTLICSLVMLFSLLPLARMHFVLLIRNSTTLEDIGGSPAQKGSPYDLGKRRNVEQVLGPKSCLWFCPCHTVSSLPIGDGVRWRQEYSRLVNMEAGITK